TNSTGTFTPATSCTLAAGATAGTATCSVTYTPGASATGHHLITGNYAGDSSHTTSSGTFLLAVTPAPPHPTTTAVQWSPGSRQRDMNPIAPPLYLLARPLHLQLQSQPPPHRPRRQPEASASQPPPPAPSLHPRVALSRQARHRAPRPVL